MLEGTPALERSGTPATHGACFQYVANETRCIISSRSVGKYATSLLLESYATKGFHNKAKSCDWGPMAGFVLADPAFTKRGTDAQAMATQTGDLKKALGYGAGKTPVYITDRRRLELRERLGCLGAPEAGSNINTQVHTCKGKKFVLTRAFDQGTIDGYQLWGVNYAAGTEMYDSDMKRTVATAVTPVLSMVDPACPNILKGTPRSATTGDYDLFAIFPPYKGLEKFSKQKDARPVVGSSQFPLKPREFVGEDEHMGNITARGRMIKDKINARVIGSAGYSGGNVVHHSDEAGRPFVNEIDFPWIAWIPQKGDAVLVQNTTEFKEFITRYCLGKYYVTINPGWRAALGIGWSMGGHHTV
jgi:hypothetical protein